MPTVGMGVREIRVGGSSGAYRVIHVATLPDAIHVLHVFQKKTQKTRRRDLDLASARLKEMKRGKHR
jgi:phage-related protein